MKEKLSKIKDQVESAQIRKLTELEEFRVKFLGSKGIIKDLFSEFKSLPKEEKKDLGKHINELKVFTQAKFDAIKTSLDNQSEVSENSGFDYTRPVHAYSSGSVHPLSYIEELITSIFNRIGYTVSTGPEIEDDWHNFSALNFPPEHPARDMQDTFFIEKGENEMALRTHTSSVQVRVMKNNKPPIRTISPGRVYRNEAISARAHCFFHQVEVLYIDKDVSFADLKQTLLYFAKEMFGESTQIRLRPSYFPFTEPSAEMDISCTICEGKGCNVCKYSGWLEILGCGMVDPNVLKSNDIDPEEFSGFAFGMGIERIAQLKFRVNDLRLYSQNDKRFLDQFKTL